MKDKTTGQIVCNPKTKDKCILLRTIDINAKNRITDKGLSKVEADLCNLGDESYGGFVVAMVVGGYSYYNDSLINSCSSDKDAAKKY